MSDEKFEVRDPVHAFVTYNSLERDLLNSRPMQRLKRIKQLAFTYEVYPGATHSRFEHSVGTMHLASQAFDSIVSKGGPALRGRLGWTPNDVDRYRQILRLGALLHDVGHSPFSHAPEELLPKEFDGHEGYTELIIRSEHVRPILEEAKPFNIDVEEVVTIALGPKKKPTEDLALQFLGDLVAGELGVDRMDYLVRDSLHSGAAPGRFDYQRLINTLIVVDHPDNGSPILAIDGGGRHAAEGLLLARYFMFLGVYFHPVRRIYDAHLLDFLRVWLSNGKFPSDVEEFLKLTDETVDVAIDSCDGSGQLDELARRLRNRNHFRKAYEMPDDLPEEDPKAFERLSNKILEEFKDRVKVDQSTKAAYSIEIGELFIRQPQGLIDILQISHLIRSLRPMWIGRIYAAPPIREEVKKRCSEFESAFRDSKEHQK